MRNVSQKVRLGLLLVLALVAGGTPELETAFTADPYLNVLTEAATAAESGS